MARQIGYTQEEIDALAHIGEEPAPGETPPAAPGRAARAGAPAGDDGEAGSGPFDPALTTALIYARKMTGNAHDVTDDLFARMRRHWSDNQILEITCVVGLANYWNRFTTALRIDLSGTNEPYDPPAR